MKGKPEATNPDTQIDVLIQILRSGSPRAAYQAGQQVIGFGSAAEEPLIRLLSELKDPFKQHDILHLLQAVKISHPDSVARVVGLLHHEQTVVRGAAAQCLLQSSPKLRRYTGQIQAALKQEKDPTIKVGLQKLIDRYPERP